MTDWDPVIDALKAKHANVFQTLAQESVDVYPPHPCIFNAFHHTNIADTRVVILGQDCYHGPGEANGLAFSVPDGVRTPPSLLNVFKELHREYPDSSIRKNTDLTDWAKQGVVLLNTALTVRHKSPGSHIALWKPFTTDLVIHLANSTRNVVYMLWGNHAISYVPYIDQLNNLVLTHTHPSPLSRKPFTCGHFAQANEYLQKHGKRPVNWSSAA